MASEEIPTGNFSVTMLMVMPVKFLLTGQDSLTILMQLSLGKKRRSHISSKKISTGGSQTGLHLQDTQKIFPAGQGYHQILMQLLPGVEVKTCISSRVHSTGNTTPDEAEWTQTIQRVLQNGKLFLQI